MQPSPEANASRYLQTVDLCWRRHDEVGVVLKQAAQQVVRGGFARSGWTQSLVWPDDSDHRAQDARQHHLEDVWVLQAWL